MDIDRRSDHRILFKGFELNLLTRELYRRGLRVRLHGQPVEVLSILVASPGELVTREALKKALWPEDTFVDFEHSLNSTINRLREALGDDADRPRFIETIPRLGYRFIAPISTATSFRSGTTSKPQETTTALAEETAVPRQLVNRPGIQVETRIRLAVLPFTNLGDEPQDHLSDGLTAQIIVQLGHMYKDVSVISPVTSLHFEGSIHSFPQIAERLQANFLLVGTVWRISPRLRISAQLIRAEDQCCAWSESYTRLDTDILSVLDEITRDISRGLQRALPKPIAAEVHLKTTPSTYEKYLRARFYAYKLNQAGFEKAIGLFEQIIGEDPDFALAYAGLAHMLAAAVVYGGSPPRSLYERIERLSTEALRRSEGIAEAYSALAHLRVWRGDWGNAEKEFLHALDINPSFTMAFHGYSHLLVALHRLDEAIMIAKRERELDPFSPLPHMILGLALYADGQFAESLECEHHALEIDPAFGTAHASLSMIYETMGEMAQAVSSSRAAVQHSANTPFMLCHLARSLAVAGEREEATRTLDDLLRIHETYWVSPAYFALIYAALGEHEQAWAWLERSVIELDPWRVFIAVDPRFKFFASDARFPELLKQIGLTPQP
jgi:TolB-like protein/Tfp pilus assembly protein PilF